MTAHVLKVRGALYLRMRSLIILFALIISASAAVCQDADDLLTVIPRLHGQPKMVRNMAGQWEAAEIVYQDADIELSVPVYLLDGELAVDALSSAPLPLPWDGSGGYLIALYSFYKTRHGCILDLQAAKHDSPENLANCPNIRYQQRFLMIDPQNHTVTELSYVFMSANGLAHLQSPWSKTTYRLDGPIINAHVTMLRKAITHLQPLADRHASANANVRDAYKKMREQAAQYATESTTPLSQGGSILQETPEMRTRMEQRQAELQARAPRDQVDSQRWRCRASGYTTQECETRFPYPSPQPAATLLDHSDKPKGVLAQTASKQDIASIEQKAFAFYKQKDYVNARPLFEQACTGSSFTACTSLGYIYQNQLGVAQDFALAATLYKKGCDGGNSFACSQLGYMYQNRLGVEQDYPLAVTLFSKSCAAGSVNGCLNLGYSYQHSLGVAQDYPRAVSLFTQGCNAGIGNGCNSLGFMFETGSGVVKDLTRAVALYSRACDANDPDGCSDLGHCYLVGNGVEKDIEKAKLFFRKGCSLGSKFGCEQIQKLP